MSTNEKIKTFDVIANERDKISLQDFRTLLHRFADEYAESFEDANDFHRQPHTLDEWLTAWKRWLSW